MKKRATLVLSLLLLGGAMDAQQNYNGLGLSLGNLSRLSRAKSRSLSAENFTGEKGKGGMADTGLSLKHAVDLGKGWKVSPAVRIQAGAPPGVLEGELVSRRLLLQQLVRAYQGQRSEATSTAIAERRRADVEIRIKEWKGFDEKPPYSMLLVDRLRENLQKESLRIEAQEARLRVIDSRIESGREVLDRFQGQLRREQENLEGKRRDAGVASLATCAAGPGRPGRPRRRREPAYLELSRESAAKDLDVTRLEFAFVETQLKEAETQVRFSSEDLDAVQARIKSRHEALQKELDAALTERDAVERGLEGARRSGFGCTPPGLSWR